MSRKEWKVKRDKSIKVLQKKYVKKDNSNAVSIDLWVNIVKWRKINQLWRVMIDKTFMTTNIGFRLWIKRRQLKSDNSHLTVKEWLITNEKSIFKSRLMSQAWKSVESSQVKNDKSHVSDQKWQVTGKIKSDKSKIW